MNTLRFFDLAGTAVFAVTGALAGGRKRMDLFGILVVALVTAVGGGTIRDVTLGLTPVFWIRDPSYLATASLAAIVTFVAARRRPATDAWLKYADAVGLAVFAALGADRALAASAPPVIAVAMGVITAVAGGIIRDVLCNEVPLILSREIYATAALAGAGVFVGLHWNEAPAALCWGASVVTAFGLRLTALRWHLRLPTFAPSGR